MARLGAHYEVARLLQALHWAADKDRHDNHMLLQTALQEEAATIQRERLARDKHYRAVRAYDAWQEQNSVSNHAHVEPGACQFRLEQRVRLDSPSGNSSCSSCQHSSVSRSEGRASRRPAVRPLRITPHQADKNLAHVGHPGHIYPYSNYPAQEDRVYGRCRTSSQVGSGGGSQRKKLPFGIRKSARVRPRRPWTGGMEVQPSLSVTVVGMEPAEDRHQGHTEGKIGEEESGVTEAKEEEEDGLGSPGELTFHEVQQQNLKGLPDAMYLQELLGPHSPMLQPPPDSRDKDRRLSLSQINHRHNVYRGKMHRRLSLGAIPEGRMVRKYYEEEEEEEDMLGSVLWNSVAWQVVLASQRQCNSAPPSPVSDAQRSVLNARILGRLGTAADEERELVYSDGSSSEEGEEEEEGRQVPRPDTPLPFLAYSSPSSSSHSLSSLSSPRLISPPNTLEDCEPSSNVVPSSTDVPPDQVPSSTDVPPDQVLSSTDVPPDQVLSSTDVSPDQVLSSTDVPPDQVPSSTDVPPDQVPSSTDVPPDQVPSSTDVPPDQVPSSTDVPPDQVPSSADVPPDQVPSSTDAPPDQVLSSTDAPPDQVPSSTDAPPGQVLSSTDAPPDQVLSSTDVPPDQVPSSTDMLDHPSSPVWQDRCDVLHATRTASLCIVGGQILPSSRPSQPLSRSTTPRTPAKRESPRSGPPGRASPLRSKSSAGIRGTSSVHRLSSRQTQSSCTLPPCSTPEGRVALQPSLMQFGGGLVAVTAGLK